MKYMTKVIIRLILSVFVGLFFYFVPPINPLVIICSIILISYITSMWLSLYLKRPFVILCAVYVAGVLGFAAYGILDLVNAILIHLLLFMIILLLKKKTSIESP